MNLEHQILDTALMRNEPDYRLRHLTTRKDFVRAMPKALAAVLRTQREALKGVEKDERLSPEGKQARRDEINGWARQKMESMRAGLTIEARRAQEDIPAVNKLTAEQQADFNNRAPRLWERVRHQLDNGVDIATVIQNADRETLAVIEEEIGAYQLAKHSYDERMANLQAQAAKELINQHRPNVLTPEEAKRLREWQDFETGVNNVAASFNWAEAGLEDESVNVLPAFERGTSIDVGE